MDLVSIAELLAVVGGVLGGQKGLEVYRRRKLRNGNGDFELRKNSLSMTDREFIKECFSSLEKDLRIGRLQLADDLRGVMQKEGETIRVAVRSLR